MSEDKRMQRFFKKNIFVSLLLSTALCFLTLTIFLVYANYWNEKQIADINLTFAESGGNIVNVTLAEAETFAISLSNQLDVSAYIASDDNEYFDEKCRSLFRSFRTVNGNIDDVFIVRLNTDSALYDSGVRAISDDERAYFEFDDSRNETKYYFLRKDGIYPYLIRIVRGVFLGDAKGAVVVDVNIENLGDTFKDANYSANVKKSYILSADDEILYGDNLSTRFKKSFWEFADEKDNGSIVLDGETYMVTRSRRLKCGLQFVSLLSFEERTSIFLMYWRLLIPSIAFMLMVSVVFSFLITRYSVRPLSALMYTIGNNQNGKSGKTSPEIQYILDSLKSKFLSEGEMEAMLSVRLMRLKLEQIRALEAQINPHFLYNTLDSINWSIYEKLGRNNEISKRIVQLSEMLRMGFQAADYIVSFEDELRHAQAYRSLLQYGEANLTEVEFRISEETLSKRTVKFILQPLIENAIRHGVAEDGGGKILVSTYVKNDCFVIRIEDNGVGMSKEKLDTLNKEFSESFGNIEEELKNIIYERVDENSEDSLKFSSPDKELLKKKHSGIGLKNVNNRIQLAFGENYGLELFANEPTGLVVVVRQPIKE